MFGLRALDEDHLRNQQRKCASLLSACARRLLRILAGDTGYAIRSEFQEMCGRSTVPNVFIGGESVGGFTDGVEALQAEGKLKGMLEAAGALLI